MSDDKEHKLAAGCTLAILAPLVTMYSGAITIWEAYVLHRIWVWHLANYFDSIQVMSITRIFAVLLALWVIRNAPRMPRHTDDRTKEEQMRDMLASLLGPALVPALALFLAWWAT
jgi:hypothetical protein